MSHLLYRIDIFEFNIKRGDLEAAEASKRLIDKAAIALELKVWRYASRIILEQL